MTPSLPRISNFVYTKKSYLSDEGGFPQLKLTVTKVYFSLTPSMPPLPILCDPMIIDIKNRKKYMIAEMCVSVLCFETGFSTGFPSLIFNHLLT